MTVNAITDTKKGRTGIAPTYLHTTPGELLNDHIMAVWNSLPTELRSPDISLDVFKARLKTFLFNC